MHWLGTAVRFERLHSLRPTRHAMRPALVLAALLALSACRSSGPPAPAAAGDPVMAEQIVGRWEMNRVLDRGDDVTAIHNPSGNRYVELRADGTFESGGDPYGVNTGTWSLDPGYNELSLESDLGSADDTYWIVTLDGDAMEWAGVRSETARRFRILSRRTDG